MKNYFLVTLVALGVLCSCGGHMNNEDNAYPRSSGDNAPAEKAEYTEDLTAEENMAPVSETESVGYATENKLVQGGAETQATKSSRQNFPLSSSAAEAFLLDTTRKFIRTADMRFRVGDLRYTTYGIEDITKHFEGFVTYTHLNSHITRKRQIRMSPDSLLESTYYYLENSMTLRVPNIYLDTVIRLIGRHIDYLDYRTINANDITLDLLSNKLKRKRLAKFQHRMEKSIDEKGKKLNDIESAENALLARAEQDDNTLIETLRTLDQVEYSTINLFMYEREHVLHELIADDKNIEDYEPSFWSKAGDSIYFGWKMLQELLLGLLKIWFPLLVIIVVLSYIFKKLKPFGNSKKE